MILQLFTLLGSLGIFLYGMGMMSSGLQKAVGDKLRTIFLPWMTSNPLKRVISGLGITATIQSSSATTVMVVSYVNAGLLTLAQAVSVIMGANIGTTVTPWLISLLGFGFNLSYLVFPLVGIGFIASMSKKSKAKEIGELIIGFALMFLGLMYMKSAIPPLSGHPQAIALINSLSDKGFWSVIIFVIIGILITFILQSSSASVSLTLILISMGWLPFDMSAAMVLGANIGTTITANIAATIANVQAKRAALIHSLFNIFGVFTWGLIFFYPFLRLTGKITTLTGCPDPNTLLYTTDALTGSAAFSSIYGIAIVHTMFNVINTMILIGLSGIIVRIVTWAIKDPQPEKDKNGLSLKYIRGGLLSTPSLSLEQAFNEIINFAHTAQEGFAYVNKAVNENDADKFEEYRMKLVECEEVTDKFEYEIASFLNGITTNEISGEEAEEVKVMYRIIGELESIGDSCENISRILNRLRVHKQSFDENAISNINLMVFKVNEAFAVMLSNLNAAGNDKPVNIEAAYACEKNINSTRNTLRDQGIQQIEKQSENYQSNNYFLDLIAELEAMGDFIINISQAIVKDNTD
ncbi:MAG: Na/Pi cotransporter family protein [Bacteroidales bacterium]|jgi:phosphate:Na+ symporter|nr:Na/Pi cotransporter family protein [Bacteroidales bacterium]